MKRYLSMTLAVSVVVLVSGAAFAQMRGGWMAGGMGPGMMGGGGPNQIACPGMTGSGQTPAAQLTEEKARELAEQYAKTYLPGFTVERVVPFAGMHMTMYQAELKGPQGEARALHINPWGNVMPFGGPVTR